MAETIGSPKANDPMARQERIANEVLDRAERIVNGMVPKIVNRPFGSEKLSDDDLLRDWEPVLVDRGQAQVRLQELMKQEGEERGRTMFAEAVLKVQKLVSGG